MVETPVGEHLVVAAAAGGVGRLDVDLQRRGEVADEPGPGRVAVTGLGRRGGEHRGDRVAAVVRPRRDVHHRFGGEQLQHRREPAGVAVGVVAGHQITDLLPGLEFPVLHRHSLPRGGTH